MIPKPGDKVVMESPYGLYHRGNNINIDITINNGATGTFRGVKNTQEYIVDWDYIAIEVPVPQHWIRKSSWQG